METIEDLKNGLEEKVARRTGELEATNRRFQEAQLQISTYIDPHVTEKIFKGEFSAELSHQRKKLTLFFSDIKDFTQFRGKKNRFSVRSLTPPQAARNALAIAVQKVHGTGV